MNEKNYKKRLDYQQKLISKKNEEIESLKLEIKERDEIIESVSSLKEELIKDRDEIKKYKKEYKALVDELRKMKEIINQEVYRGRWRLVKFLIK